MFGRLRCTVGWHQWQQKPDPRGYGGGPTAIYSVCYRCEKQRWAHFADLDHNPGSGYGPDGGAG